MEAIVNTNRNICNSMALTFESNCFNSKRSNKYLDIQIDARMRFVIHAGLASKRVVEACRQLSRHCPKLEAED